jgi:ParB family transcriptional regulator, chromosome partitioning protein
MPPRKKKPAANSRGLLARDVTAADPPADVTALATSVNEDGGQILSVYRDPLGGNWQIMACLPLGIVHPTPFQRDLSATHAARLAEAINKLDRFLDPVITVRSEDGQYWTPNGHHRTAAMRALGARSIVAIVVPDEDIALRILALNTEKAHNLKERSLEVIRMAQSLAELDPRPEADFATMFEDASLLTLGICYQDRPRFAGSVFHSVLKRIDKFLTTPIPTALGTREVRAGKILELDTVVADLVNALKERGFQSPYLKAYVFARLNPIRFKRGPAPFEQTINQMLLAAYRFDVGKIREDQLARAGGPPGE